MLNSKWKQQINPHLDTAYFLFHAPIESMQSSLLSYGFWDQLDQSNIMTFTLTLKIYFRLKMVEIPYQAKHSGTCFRQVKCYKTVCVILI